MKYRIKDPDERKAIEILTGVSEFSADDARRHCWQVLNNYLHFGISGKVVVEPVPGIINGWHPFPADKPEKVGKYIVAYDCDGEREVDVDVWNGENFFPADDDVVAWREFPKYW